MRKILAAIPLFKKTYHSLLKTLHWLAQWSSLKYNFHPEIQIYILSVRKAGTHLISRLLQICFIRHHQSHLLFLKVFRKCKQNPKLKVLVIVRDPRDVCISGVFWRTNLWDAPGPHGDPMNDKEMLLNMSELNAWNAASFDEKLTATIAHELPLPYSQINLEYELAKEALNYPNFLLLRFEDLIGSQGGGSDETQGQQIRKILHFIGKRATKRRIKKIKKNLFGSTATFRRGKIGTREDHFTPEHKKLFKEKMGHILIEWKYESDQNW